MKSLHFYLRAPAVVPPERADGIPPERREELRNVFNANFKRHRKRSRVALVCTVTSALGFWCLLFFLPKQYVGWAGGGFIASLVLGALMFVVFPFPCCPACQRSPNECSGEFCPECGAQELKQGNLAVPPHCSACKQRMGGSAERRRYKIHACTHCGLWLSDAGI